LTEKSSLIESRYFDDLADRSGNFNPFAPQGWQTIKNRFQQFIEPQSRLQLLDIGCGTGQSRQLYQEYCELYVGIDLSYRSLQLASLQCPQSQWACADACSLPFEENSFDVVAFSSVLHHIPDFTIALSEAIRVVRPQGFIFAFDPNLYHPAMALFRYPRSPFYISAGVSPNERPLRPKDLRDRFLQVGLTNVQQRCQSNIPYRHVAPKLLNTCLSMYNFCDYMFEHSGLGRWFGTFVITAGQKFR